MNPTTSHRDLTAPAEVLAAAATAAAHCAPSILNTQPWRWRVRPGRLELFAEPRRHLGVTDPDGRLLMLSCGAVLHHAGVALAVQGWRARVVRTPSMSAGVPLAVCHGFERIAITPTARPQDQAMRTRHTDRRPVSDQPLAAPVIRAITATARGAVGLQILSAEQVLDLAAAASRAGTVQARDPLARKELDYWTSRPMTDGIGLPPQVLPERPAQTTVPGRGFGHAGTLPIGAGHDRAATYALLYGDGDEPAQWLQAGEALSALWLTATALEVAVLPLSDVITVPGTREALRRMLKPFDHPYLALRLGIAEPAPGAPPRTPRLPTAHIVEVVSPDDA
ncbi:nitroreductase [Actinoplanes sp. KI2]|uniref:Acg family FMN-binding oxidoreductase n=1 Tax=Actinoplanes sp. KI2 TaxID=2983315 RepID=UPI0021D5D5C0|nr:nitroreductase [Actinoplanes sp. KI2]MCU7730966.1 nitroreductase [Actinoplanes sp. KI2]